MVYEHKVDYEEEKDFWFNQIESHGNDVFIYGEDYYIYKILKVLCNLSLPKDGKICMLGPLIAILSQFLKNTLVKTLALVMIYIIQQPQKYN